MNPLVVEHDNVFMRVNAGHLEIRKKDSNYCPAETLYDFKPYGIDYDTIALKSFFGNVSNDAIRWCGKMGVQILHLDFEGIIYSQTLPVNWSNNGRLRLAQCRAYEDPARRLEIARAFVEAKTRKRVPESHDTILKLLNFEAVESQFFWDGMFRLFKEKFPKLAKDFKGRRRNGQDNKGAQDPINCMLNWQFTLLAGMARKYIMASGLLQEVGFLHSTTGRDWKDNRDSLTWDVVEPFREIAVRSVVDALPHIPANATYRTNDYRLRLRMQTCRVLTQSFAEIFNSEVRYRERTWHVESVMQDYVKTLSVALVEEKPLEFAPFSLLEA